MAKVDYAKKYKKIYNDLRTLNENYLHDKDSDVVVWGIGVGAESVLDTLNNFLEPDSAVLEFEEV